jgi:LPXTG-motif cell wall-anchored protein
MKRLFISIFTLALILAFSPLHTVVNAEENQKNVEETVKNIETQVKDSVTNPVAETKMEVHRKSQDHGNYYTFTAKLKDVKDAEGTWSLFVDGKEYHTKKSKTPSTSFIYNLYEEYKKNGETKGHDIKIVFEGKVDGKEGIAVGTQTIADLTVNHSQNGDKNKFTGTLTSGKSAKGNWGIAISDEKGKKVFKKKEVYNVKGTSFSHTFKGLKEGSYLVTFAYDGNVDGEDTVIVKKEKLQITKENNGNNDNNDNNNDNGDVKPTPVDNNPKPNPTPPVGQGTVDQVIDNTHKGGTLPKTATSNPIGMVAGLGLLALGGAVLGYRRFVK